jgi:hypothetical protein
VDLLEDRRRRTDAEAGMPPYSSGISTPSMPASVSALTNSVGYFRSRSSARQYSPGKRAHSARTEARISP